MRERGEGRIVNICSIGGRVSFPHLLPYTASKFALVGLSEGLRVELARDNVFVTTVCPPPMRTGSVDHAMFKGLNNAEYAWFAMGSSLPFLSIDADRAARSIVSSVKRGDAEVPLSLAADLAMKFHGLFPDITAEILSTLNAALPGADGRGTHAVSGEASRSILTPRWLTGLSDRAAERNNEIAATHGA